MLILLLSCSHPHHHTTHARTHPPTIERTDTRVVHLLPIPAAVATVDVSLHLRLRNILPHLWRAHQAHTRLAGTRRARKQSRGGGGGATHLSILPHLQTISSSSRLPSRLPIAMIVIVITVTIDSTKCYRTSDRRPPPFGRSSRNASAFDPVSPPTRHSSYRSRTSQPPTRPHHAPHPPSPNESNQRGILHFKRHCVVLLLFLFCVIKQYLGGGGGEWVGGSPLCWFFS